MKNVKLIKYFYILLSVFLILAIAVTTLTFTDIAIGLIVMWFLYFALIAGYKIKNKEPQIINRKSEKYFYKDKKVLFSILSILFSISAVYFYTGQTPISVILNILNGNSTYFQYQEYFLNNNIGQFTISKIPYILMLFFLNTNLVFSFIDITIRHKPNKFEIIYLIIISVSSLYVGLARGTNFELFQYVILLLFCIFNQKKKIDAKKIGIIILILMLSIFIYSQVIFQRGTIGYYVSNEIRLDYSSLLVELLPGFSRLITVMSGYFAFGFFHTSTFINKIWLSSFETLLLGLIPLGFRYLGITQLNYYMSNFIDLSVCWEPDISTFLYLFGVLGVFILVVFLGHQLKNIEYYINNTVNNTIYYVICYLIFMECFSLPIGNFLVISSSNKLMLIFSIILFLRRKSSKKY